MPESKRSSGIVDPHLWVLILAGGVGSRFWPASTRERPKQLLPLASDRPLIVDTVDRARALVSDDRIRILAGGHLVGPFRRVLPDLPESCYLVEPVARGTCPVLAWAAWEILRLDPAAVLVSLHSDHLIRPEEAFLDTVRAAARVARDQELLITVGVRPDRVETGYGHVQPGRPLPTSGEVEAFAVEAFHEKPDAATAGRYMSDGYLWNTGIFVWSAEVFLDEVRRHAPDVGRRLDLLGDGPDAFFAEVRPCTVDEAVLEESSRVGMVRATFAWDDVGSWEALTRSRAADAAGNVVEGDGIVVEGHGNVVFSERGRTVLFGLDHVVAVRTGEVTLVMPRSRAAELKSLLARLEDGA